MSQVTTASDNIVRRGRPRIIFGDRGFAYMAIFPAFAVFLLLVAVPAITVIAMSFQDVQLGQTTGQFVGLENFTEALTSAEVLASLSNTFIWVFGSVACEMILGLGLALLLNKRFWIRPVLRVVILAPYLIPTVVAVLVWRYMLDDIFGILNHILLVLNVIDGPIAWLSGPNWAMAAVILVGTWKSTPFAVIAILGILQAIPREPYEAAMIDGASRFQQFWHLTLPMIMPVFLVTALLRTIWAFHKFDLIFLLTGGGPVDATTTLPVLIYLRGFNDFAAGSASAIAVILLFIILVFLGIHALLMRRAERSL